MTHCDIGYFRVLVLSRDLSRLVIPTIGLHARACYTRACIHPIILSAHDQLSSVSGIKVIREIKFLELKMLKKKF